MNKICTSLDQSKKLLELGIDITTADMWWQTSEEDGVYEKECPCLYVGEIPKYMIDYLIPIPAWSLSALLKLIPPYLGEFNEGIDFGFGKSMNGKWYSAHYLQYFQNDDVEAIKTVTGDTAVDAAFEMVVWLKENGKI